MLRCTLSSLIPVINSQKYGPKSIDMFNKHMGQFEDIIKKESYYILRELPKVILDKFFVQHIPEILNKQNKIGTWKIRDGERVSFDILKALEKCNKLPNLSKDLKYDLFENIKYKTDFYSVLMKDSFYYLQSENIKNEKKPTAYPLSLLCACQLIFSLLSAAFEPFS